MKHPVLLALPFACWLISNYSSSAADWPRLGGPNSNGTSLETGLLRTWPTNGPSILWTVDVADGFAGPAIRDGQVFVLDRPSDEEDLLRCLDLKTGSELWNLSYNAPGKLPFNGSRNVPTVDEKYVFAAGPFGHFHCVDRQTHKLLWSKHLVNDFKDPQVDVIEPAKTREEKLARAQVPMWGLTQAPLLYKDLVIVAPQTKKTGLVAYEKTTGKIRWTSDYIGRNWYSHISPYLAKMCGVEQVIMLAQPSDPEKSPDDAPPAIISAIDPNTGKILWKTQTPAPHKIPIPQPLRVADDRLFITGGYKLGCLLLQLTHTADQWDAKIQFHKRTVAGHIHSPCFYKNRIYLTSFAEHGASQTGLVCLTSEGEPLWQTGPGIQFDFGALLVADDLAFVMHGKTGALNLFELADAGPKLLASAKVLSGKNGNVWAPMALSEGLLIVRDQHQMKCLDMRSQAALIKN